MKRTVEQFQRACNSLAGGVSSSTRVNQALGHADVLRPRRRLPASGTSTARNTSTSAAATAPRCWATAIARVRRAVEAALDRGAACSYENELHAELAELLCETIPCLRARPLHRLGHRGDDALPPPGPRLHRPVEDPQVRRQLPRLSRPGDVRHRHAGRPARPRDAPTRFPGSTGMPPGLERTLVLVPYNRPDLLEEAFRRHGHELAAVICEPIYYNAGCILPTPRVPRRRCDG